jgi:hypothetical protein
MIQGEPGQKVIEIPSQQLSQAWWYMPVIPAPHGSFISGTHPLSSVLEVS